MNESKDCRIRKVVFCLHEDGNLSTFSLLTANEPTAISCGQHVNRHRKTITNLHATRGQENCVTLLETIKQLDRHRFRVIDELSGRTKALDLTDIYL